jgi:hypothetical protein
MCGYLPHIINCSLVGLHCTMLSRWYTALDTKEPASTAHKKLPMRMVEVVQQAGCSMLRQWCLGLVPVPRAVE